MTEYILNFKELKKSKNTLKKGDIFIFQPSGCDYYFGRVVNTDVKFYETNGLILIYIYNSHSYSKENIPVLDKENLLIPPLITNNICWTRGVFEVVENREIKATDVYPIHCFFSSTNNKYFDENHNQYEKAFEPLSDMVLSSYKTIDIKVSKALGLKFKKD